MTDYKEKYLKYKTKYLGARNTLHGGGKSDIVILHSPNPMITQEETLQHNKFLLDEINKIGTVHHYFLKFGTFDKSFKIKNLSFENTTHNLNKYFESKSLTNTIIICFEHASPFGLDFVNKYPEKCQTIICYPLRLYTKESLDRYIWKYREQKGWYKHVSQKYSLDDYLLNINDKRLDELLLDRVNNKFIVYSVVEYNLRKQFDKIPTIFKIPTHLFSRLDLHSAGSIGRNFERKEIRDMKGIITTDDALLQSFMGNFAHVQHDEDLLNANGVDTNLSTHGMDINQPIKYTNIRIHYYIGDFEQQSDLDLLDLIKYITSK